MSGHGTRGNEVVQQQRIKRAEHTPQTFDSLIDCFSRRIGRVGIIASSPSILDIESHLELLETLGVSIVNVLDVGNELGRRSVGSRHFDVEDGLMV